MCIGIEILSQNRLHWKSCLTKVRVTVLYMYLDMHCIVVIKRKQNLFAAVYCNCQFRWYWS